jgi:hypothetical protein
MEMTIMIKKSEVIRNMERVHSHRLIYLEQNLYGTSFRKINIYYKKSSIDRIEVFDLPFRVKHLTFVRRLNQDGTIILPVGPHCRSMTIDPFTELQKFCSPFPKIKFDKKRKSISYRQ